MYAPAPSARGSPSPDTHRAATELCWFLQLNTDKTAFQRTFANYVKRCDEMERVLRYLESSCKNYNIKLQNQSVDRHHEPNFTDLQVQPSNLATVLDRFPWFPVSLGL